MALFEKQTINIPFRANITLALALSCFVVITFRLWYLQIINGDFFRSKSENNRIRMVFQPPPRGLVLDRNGAVLAKNRPSFDIELVTEDSPDPRATVIEVARILAMDPEKLLEQLKAQKKRRRFEPKLLIRDASRDTVAKIVARRYALPGVEVAVTPTRDYVHGALASHALGYIREITSRQLDSPHFALYRSGDMVGQSGLESIWEYYLQGKRGVHRVVVNAMGTKIDETLFEAANPGHDITLTIDLDVQKAADKEMEGKRGAVVALDPMSGEILALASAPAFDPNLFTAELSADLWKDLISSREKKLNNRPLQGVYPPGSVFKIFMAAAGLAEGVISPTERVFCPGYLTVGSRRFRCHKHSGHGSVNMEEAMIQSCDVYFYTVGQRLGVDRIFEYATRFGLGQKTGLKLSDESIGLIPSTEWKRRYFRNPEDQKWYPGETPSVSIGQGAVTVTPMQIARGLSALVNGGRVLVPYIVKQVNSADAAFKDSEFGPEVSSELNIDPAILERVKKALVGVVYDQHGTGRRAKLPDELGIKVGGKTGTAQVVSLEYTDANDRNDHAWFAGFAPADKPEIVVAAIVENGGHGGVTAAPIVEKVMEAFFRKKLGKPEGPPANGKTVKDIQEGDLVD